LQRNSLVVVGKKDSPWTVVLGYELIYMSIDDAILDRWERGMLFPILPKARGATIRRALFVNEALHQVLTSPEGDRNWEQRIGNLQADLEVFVEAPTIGPKYLFLLYPARDAVWEIRSAGYQPSIRVLCLFASKDILIATGHALRESLNEWESREWKIVKRDARAAWRRLFDPYQPVEGTDAKALITGALDGKYFKTFAR
jgi:hypothetical protein